MTVSPLDAVHIITVAISQLQGSKARCTMRRVRRSISVLSAILLMTAVCLGQAASDKKAHTFHGKVEAVNKSANSLTVNGEKVEGWMDAMTMDYTVDDPSILDKLKPGDQIVATVYDGDYSLHRIQIMRKNAVDSRSKKMRRARVGDHFVGRFWWPPSPTTGRTHRNPGRFEVGTGGFTKDAGRLLYLPQRPSQPSQS
jgi:Cu/Ag efflux protein CusF